MRASLNERLLCIPLYDLTFITPFSLEEIYYEQVETKITDQWFEQPTLLILSEDEEINKLNNEDVANQLIQNPQLLAIVICKKANISIQDEILIYFEELQIPIIHIEERTHLSFLLQEENVRACYSQLSKELSGFTNIGFMQVATNLSYAFSTPMVFFDENEQLLWQTGIEDEVRKASRWLYSQSTKAAFAHTSFSNSSDQSYEKYTMNIAGQVNIYVVVSAHLYPWQKSFINKFIGLTAVVFQTDELVREQNEKFKELFIYELLYRKFESKKLLVKQGKTWGWNLERAHYLLLINIDQVPDPELDVDWLEEIVYILETKKEEISDPVITFPFQDQVIVLVEGDKEISPSERKEMTLYIANWILEKVTADFPTMRIQVGIGKWYRDTIYLNKSYQEAKMALQFGSTWLENQQVFHISNIGVPHLLSHVHREILFDFCQEYLSHLKKSDRENDTEYLKTLKMYIQNQGVINEIAKALYIHPNTLRNRIKKIEEITGIDLQNLDELMNLMVAVKVYFSFFHKKN